MPSVLLVQGRGFPKPEHWQERWSRELPDCRWVRRPGRYFDIVTRVAALHEAIAAEPEPPVLVAHSGGCVTVAQWAAEHRLPVHAALLVAPPYLDPEWTPGPDDPPEERFPAVVHIGRLPFRTVVVASRTDPWATYEQSASYASGWGATLVDAGDAGHINTAAGYGPWPAGERLLADLLR